MITSYEQLRDLKRSYLSFGDGSVCLCLLSAADLRLTFDWRNRDDIRRWFINSQTITWEQHLAWWQAYQQRENDFVFIIKELQLLRRPVGQVSLYNIDLEKHEAEYGRLMIGDERARGQGIATRATRLLLNWAFHTLGIQRIYLQVLKDNLPAVKLYHACGFTIERNEVQLYLMSILHYPSSTQYQGESFPAQPNRIYKSTSC